jgi:RNA polymerase sigma-70 factor (ECF subfamily)
VDAQGEAVAPAAVRDRPADLEAIFIANYARIARVIARVVRDRARAEELAVEVFLKWSTHSSAHGEGAEGWIYRTAVRMGLDELRREARRGRYEQLMGRLTGVPATPADIHAANEDRGRVRSVLGAMRRRDAELIVLRSQGLSYQEIAAAMNLTETSVGTLLSRAQQSFRKEYTKRYGQR